MPRPAAVTVRSIDSGKIIRVVSADVPSSIARAVWARDGLCCRYCGFWSHDDATKFELDHVYPRSLGGEHTMDNIVVACRRCNSQKSNELGWTPLSVRDAKNKRRERKWITEQGQKWRWHPDRRCLPA